MTDAPRLPRELVFDPGFTPGQAHFPGLFALLAAADRDEAPRLERVLARAGEPLLDAVLARLDIAEASERARLINVLGRVADARAGAALRRALEDADARVARRAATALGKLDESAENDAALRSAWARADDAFKRSLAEALGKVGGPGARDLIAAAEQSTDAELARIAQKAVLLFDRRQSRGTASSIRTTTPLGKKRPLLARCRAGLSALLADELSGLCPARASSESLVEVEFAGSFGELYVARTALDFGVRVDLPRLPKLADAVAAALASPEAEGVLRAWTEGSPRYRVSFSEGGHQRALVVEIARAVTARLPALVNDTRDASWEFVVVRGAPVPHLVLVPLPDVDPRFSYRKRDVRAASHPTLAAALARAARAKRSDVVWDPFVGSGLELVELARLAGPVRLLGSDLDAKALEAAEANLRSAGVRADLREGDSLALFPEGVTLIVTNPPMGRRLVRDSTLGNFLDAFVAHAARVLVPGGRLVWLSPLPDRTRRAARHAGLDAGRPGPMVDLGGFDAELQAFQRY